MLETCRAQADLVSQRWPTDARAWLLVAQTSFDLGEQERFSDALARSQQFAPAAQWLAERRLTLAGKAVDLGPTPMRPTVGPCSTAMSAPACWPASGWRGRGAAYPIEASAEAADPALQQRLLDKIRELAAASR